MHARIAATLESRFSESVAAEPAIMAQHCTRAGLDEKAVGYWLKAGQQSAARSAMTEAVAQLRKGLDLLSSLPEDPCRTQQELDLQIALEPGSDRDKRVFGPGRGRDHRAGASARQAA